MKTNHEPPLLAGEPPRRALAITLALILSTAFVSAQTVDTAILGTVIDSTGAAIPNAEVTVTSPATGVSHTVKTGPNGSYAVRYLLPGTYNIIVSAAGFRRSTRENITLQLSQEAQVNIPLAVGGASESVEVQGTAPVLNTTNATLGGVVTPEQTVNLPLNGRKFSQLAVLTPGVEASSGSTNARFAVNGTRNIWMQVSFNGVTAVDNRQNFVATFPSVDAIEEFKVNTGNYSAEYGGNAGAIVSVQLKSGTNQFHGSVFEFLRNDVLDARDYFRAEPLSKNPLHRNQFGAVLSGPIIKDRTFFMASYEGTREHSSSPSTAVTFSPQELNGDFSFLLNRTKPIQLINPSTRQPIPNNNIASLMDPNALNIAKTYMPAPNIAGAVPGQTNFAGQALNIVREDQGMTRVDHKFSESDQFFAHYIFQNGHFPTIQANPNFPVRYDFPNHNFGAQYVHTFSPMILNETRFGLQFGTITQLSPRASEGFSISKTLGIQGFDTKGGPGGPPIAQELQGFPQLRISGLLAMGDSSGGQAKDISRTYQVVDNVSIMHGSHFIKVGADLRKIDDGANTSNQPWGNETFTGDLSGYSAADFLLGLPYQVQSPEGIPINAIRQWRVGAYAQDDWTVNNRLTLNIGLRYDWVRLPRDTSGISRTLRFDLVPGQAVLWPDYGRQADLFVHPNLPPEPRLGFAYKVNNRNVIRGGFGLFASASHFDNFNILQLNPPFAASIRIVNPKPSQGPPTATLEQPLPTALIQNPTYDVVSMPPDRIKKDGYMGDWNLQYQTQLTTNSSFQVGYVGTAGKDLDTTITNWNSPDPGPGLIQSRRPYPQYGQIRMTATNGDSIYHAMQAKFERRFANGFSLTAAYTLSHMIDDQQGASNGSRAQAQNPRQEGTEAERANSAQDRRHLMTIGYVWDLPFGKSMQGIAGALLKGWQSSGIITFRTGTPILILQSGDAQNTNSDSERPNLVAGQKITVGNPTVRRWFNTDAFTTSGLGYGNTPRDPAGLYGPGMNNFDLSISRSFAMPYKEGHAVMFRAELFNAFNTPHFSNPSGTFGTSTFGQITSTAVDNREIQFALKYTF